MADPLFYAQGNAVYQRPNDKGQMGFKVCDCTEGVQHPEGKSAADIVAESLNLATAIGDAKQAFGRGLPHWHKLAKRLMHDE